MHPRTRQPGFMLLEVLVAIGLLVLGMAVIGGQVQTAADLTRETDHLARLVFLAESRLAEIDSGLVVPNEEIGDETGVEVEEDFGRLFPAVRFAGDHPPDGHPGTGGGAVGHHV
jgi:hypothetical protein